jgi:eukaryotic-like serine/threonine-protein kinase
MERTTFLEYYRIRTHPDGTPIELRRAGIAITYEAADERAGETVALTIIPIEGLGPAAQQQFEERAHALQRLRHINIVKLLDFGREGENFVCVSDYLQAVTLAEWVGHHGPMAADATLRMAEQVVSVLSSANFHKLAYPAIQPANVIVVPGVTSEGTWPLIKLTDLGLPGFRAETDETEKREETVPALETVDFASQIYFLGATMYFLLTGSELSTPVRPRQLRVFPKPLRALLSQMLRRKPGQRPKDPVALAEMIRECLLKIERRQKVARKLGIPLIAKSPRIKQKQPRRLRRLVLATSVLIALAAVIALFLSQERIGRVWEHYRGHKTIGVLVGVPEASPVPAVQSPSTPMTPEAALSQAATGILASGQQSQPNTSTGTSSAPAASPNVEPAQTSNAQLEASANPASSPAETTNPVGSAAENSAQANATPQPVDASQTSSQSKKKRVASTSQGPIGSTRAHFVGITSDGRLIYRLPSGRTKIVAPDAGQEEIAPRRHRRAFIERDETLMPQQQPFERDNPPYD